MQNIEKLLWVYHNDSNNSCLEKKGYKIEGPLCCSIPLFIYDYRNYWNIVGMYHDQVIAPFKTLFKFNAINTTLGLEYLRVSSDHGTAKDLIGKNKAVMQKEFGYKVCKSMVLCRCLRKNWTKFSLDKNIIKKIIKLVKIQDSL